MLGVVFAESQTIEVDIVKDKERMFQLSYSEFVYFLCRMTQAHYDDTPYSGEPFWVKLDNMIVFLLDPFDLKPQFRFNAKFSSDALHSFHATSGKSSVATED